MSSTSTQSTTLIAAENPHQADALRQLISQLRPGTRTLVTAGTGEDDEVQPTIVVTVEPLGAERGKLSRRMRATYPDAALVMVALHLDEAAIDVAAEVGAASLVPAPCETRAMFEALVHCERKRRYAGRCAGVEIAELLGLHLAAKSSGLLHLTGEGRTGAIQLEDGQPIHAYCGQLQGAEAVRDLLDWTEVEYRWVEGHAVGMRTIVGRIEGLLERDLGRASSDSYSEEEAPRDVLAKLERLAGIEDIFGAYLLRNTEVVIAYGDPSLDEVVIGRALTGLARVYHDMEEQQGDGAGSEIQATVGEHRLVVDRIGPARLGFQVGVVVRQATPVCKSLRRLLRQIDRSFRKSLATRRREAMTGSSAGGPGREAAAGSAGLHRVA